MILKVPYPGRAIEIDHVRWWKGHSFVQVRGFPDDAHPIFFPLLKSESCDKYNNNRCTKNADWYGYDIEYPDTVHALYRCKIHKNIIRIKLVRQLMEHRYK